MLKDDNSYFSAVGSVLNLVLKDKEPPALHFVHPGPGFKVHCHPLPWQCLICPHAHSHPYVDKACLLVISEHVNDAFYLSCPDLLFYF